MDEILTIEEVAQYLKLSKKTIQRLIEKGELPAIRFDRAIRLRKPDVEAFLAKRLTVTGGGTTAGE